MLPATFQQVKQPVLSLYYYKNEKEQDPVVKVSAIQKMMGQLGTAENLKKSVAIPEVGNHVLASPIQSKDIQSVEKETRLFLQEVMKLPLQPAHYR
jgi:hypothetical protein